MNNYVCHYNNNSFFSCDKNNYSTGSESDDITSIKESFYRASLTDNHTLWGSLNKKIDWNDPNGIKKDSSAIYISIHIQDTLRLGLQKSWQGQYYQVWLKATKSKKNHKNYNLGYLTLLTTKPSIGFTRLIFIEGITDNSLVYRTIVDGNALAPKQNVNLSNSAGGNKMSAWREECQTIWAIVNDVYQERQTCRMVFDPSYLGPVDQIGPGDWDYGGSGGTGFGAYSTIPADAKLSGQENPAIDPKKYLDCFGNIPDAWTKFKVSILVQEPELGTSYHHGSNDVEHVAISLTKVGANEQSVTQVIGFYLVGANTFKQFSGPSRVVDNGSSAAVPIFYNVKIDCNMGGNAVGFQNILDKATNPPSTYHAFDSNCVFYAYQAARAERLDVPAPLTTVSVVGVVPYSGVLFETAYTPAGLGSA